MVALFVHFQLFIKELMYFRGLDTDCRAFGTILSNIKNNNFQSTCFPYLYGMLEYLESDPIKHHESFFLNAT